MRRHLALLLLLALPGSALAVPVTLQFTGTVTEYASITDGTGRVQDLNSLPTLDVFGQMTFDVEMAPAPYIFATDSYYYFDRRGGDIDFVTGSLSWAGNTFVPSLQGAELVLTDNISGYNYLDSIPYPSADDLLLLTDGYSGTGSMWRASAHLGLVIAADSLFTPDNAYPDFTSLDLTNLNNYGSTGRFLYMDANATGFRLDFTITSVQFVPYEPGEPCEPVAVSEPGTLALLGFGLAGLGLIYRRRMQSGTGSS